MHWKPSGPFVWQPSGGSSHLTYGTRVLQCHLVGVLTLHMVHVCFSATWWEYSPYTQYTRASVPSRGSTHLTHSTHVLQCHLVEVLTLHTVHMCASVPPGGVLTLHMVHVLQCPLVEVLILHTIHTCFSATWWEYSPYTQYTRASVPPGGSTHLTHSTHVLQCHMVGVLTLHTVHTCFSAACAAFFWSWLCAFFIFAIFSAFFCCDWIFCCPRAIPVKNKLVYTWQ